MNYEELKELHQKGCKVAVNLEKRQVKVNGKVVEFEPTIQEGDKVSLELILDHIEHLYILHKHSIPNTDDTKREYFKALPYDQLSEDSKIYGDDRRDTRFELEMYVLNAIMTGMLWWNENIMGKWFWKSPVYDDLVILRSWVENEQK